MLRKQSFDIYLQLIYVYIQFKFMKCIWSEENTNIVSSVSFTDIWLRFGVILTHNTYSKNYIVHFFA